MVMLVLRSLDENGREAFPVFLVSFLSCHCLSCPPPPPIPLCRLVLCQHTMQPGRSRLH